MPNRQSLRTDWERFLTDGETMCFDCGATEKYLIKISDGVVLCEACWRKAQEDYKRR